MSKPYIDQSTGENNQTEFSIHGLSKNQFQEIQNVLRLLTGLVNLKKDWVKESDEFACKPIDDQEVDEIINSKLGIHEILNYDIK